MTAWQVLIHVFARAGFELRKYRYYDPATNALDFKGMMQDLKVTAVSLF